MSCLARNLLYRFESLEEGGWASASGACAACAEQRSRRLHMPTRQASAQQMTIRARVRISMAPSPILVGRRFRPRFSEARAIFFVPSSCRIGVADARCGIRVFSDFFGRRRREWRKSQSWR